MWMGSRPFGKEGSLPRGIGEACPVYAHLSKLRDAVLSYAEVLRVYFYPDALVTKSHRRRDGRPSAHERVEYDALRKRQRRPHDLAHKVLRFKRRVRGYSSLLRPCRRGPYHVRKRLVGRHPSKATGLPLAQVILHAPLTGFAEEPPRLPAGPGHYRDLGKFLMRILWAVTTTQGLNQSNDLAALFEAGFHERQVDKMRKQQINDDKN